MVDDKAHLDAAGPAAVFLLVLEPLVQLGKLSVVEVSPRDADAIDVAAGLVERVIGQRAPQVDAHEIPTEDRGEFGGHPLKKAGKILGDFHRG
jgi:hypothetical protein